jgi:hypothetical protein
MSEVYTEKIAPIMRNTRILPVVLLVIFITHFGLDVILFLFLFNVRLRVFQKLAGFEKNELLLI